MGSDGGVYFYAQENLICQLLGDGELEWELLKSCLLTFIPKNKDEEKNKVLLEMLLWFRLPPWLEIIAALPRMASVCVLGLGWLDEYVG